ncbi:MAG: GNAT family N-acetyltransferase, partial [Lachnospiraceae bacterium]|nr:GNAT family N-acetyltransferase [Lachnospiraceae bacterium]
MDRFEINNKEIDERFDFRTITQEEAEEAAEVERVCFPPNEACSKEHMTERIKAASDLFMVAIDLKTGRIAGFLNGIATNEYDFRDEFFTDADIHDPDGENVMLLGLDIMPEYRKKGLARALVYKYCKREKERGRKRLKLTCLKEKVDMYAAFGLSDLGESASEWGGEKWHEM